jgi:hypothetical protein
MNDQIPIPTLGRTVHAVIRNAKGQLVTRPAIIVGVFHQAGAGISKIVWDYSCNVQVLTDGENDGLQPTVHKTSLPHSLSHTAENTWHWPDRV